jgi:hypothetical protein
MFSLVTHLISASLLSCDLVVSCMCVMSDEFSVRRKGSLIYCTSCTVLSFDTGEAKERNNDLATLFRT